MLKFKINIKSGASIAFFFKKFKSNSYGLMGSFYAKKF